MGLVRSSSPLTAVYIPRDFLLHAASLPQTCVHWGIFVAAAARRWLKKLVVKSQSLTLELPLKLFS